MTANAAAAAVSRRAAAQALKMQCHYTITAMGPNTPPEVFVYRGNAYQDLQQPYLALADYNAASRAMKLSGKHLEQCKVALETLPPRLTATYPSVDNHLHMIVNSTLPTGVEIKKIDDRVGRGVFTKVAMEPGTTVMTASDPWLLYPLREGSCSFCSKPLPSRVFACTNERCHEEYCSRECRANAVTTYHGKVCTNEGFQGVELDLATTMMSPATSVSDRNVLAGQLLAMRVVGAALLNRTVPSSMPEVRSLSGRLVFEPKVMSGPVLDLYDKLSRFCGFATSIFFEEFIGVIARIRSNCFQNEANLQWHVPRSMLNHSCDPNVEFDAATRTLKTICGVRAGSELTMSYFPHLNHLPSEARRTELLNRDFVCLCPKCVAGY